MYRDISAGLAARMALEKYGFRFSHSLGQNFILDDGLIERIVEAARVTPGENILEIGPGAGVMTRHLADAGANVTAVERDKSLEPVLRDVLEGNDVRLVFGDAEERLDDLEGTFDFLFLDAAKAQYIRFLPGLKARMHPGSVLVADNVLQEGDILESRFAVERRNRTIHARMREFLYAVRHDPELETAILPLGDGLTFSVKK